MLLTTHNLVELNLCNKVIIIHQGKLVFNDKIHDAITNLREQYFTIGLTEKSNDLTFLASNSYHFDEEKTLLLKLRKIGRLIRFFQHYTNMELPIQLLRQHKISCNKF